MDQNGISYLSIAYLLLLIIPIVIINIKLKLRINKKMFYAISRMIIQLSLVGIFLQYVFDLNNAILNFIYVILMILVASFSTAKSCGFKRKQFVLPLFLAFVIPTVVVLLFFNAFVIKIDSIFSAQFIIPIGGMLLGNSLSGNIIAVDGFYKSIKENKNQYFYALSLSGNKIEALTPYFKNSLLSSINPTIASIETIGLVALPGMMTGQILGGAIPITAIKYQIAIMIAILIARYFSAILAIIFTGVKTFDDYDILTI